jgi:hypothetical protein
MLFSGQILRASDLNAIVPSLADYTPVHTAITVGNGVEIAKYAETGDLAIVQYTLVFGTTTAITGSALFGLPVPAARQSSLRAVLIDSGTRNYVGAIRIVSPGAVNGQVTHSEATTGIATATSPFTWTTGDVLIVDGSYPIA